MNKKYCLIYILSLTPILLSFKIKPMFNDYDKSFVRFTPPPSCIYSKNIKERLALNRLKIEEPFYDEQTILDAFEKRKEEIQTHLKINETSFDSQTTLDDHKEKIQQEIELIESTKNFLLSLFGK